MCMYIHICNCESARNKKSDFYYSHIRINKKTNINTYMYVDITKKWQNLCVIEKKSAFNWIYKETFLCAVFLLNVADNGSPHLPVLYSS